MTAIAAGIRDKARQSFERLLRRVPSGSDGVARVRGRQIYIIPTRTGMSFGAVLILMLLASLNYQNNLGLLFTFFLASVGVIAMHHAWFNLLGLAVQVRGGQPVFAGEPAMFEVTLRAEGRRPRYDLRVRRAKESAEPIFVPADDQRAAPLRVPTKRRGHHRLRDLTIETRHPMHLFKAWCLIGSDASTLVFPAPANSAPEPGQDGGDTRLPHRSAQEGAEDYVGSRPYRDGDSPRHIDWKAYARERGLVVKQYSGDQGQEVWIDWYHLNAADPELRLSQMARQILDADTAQIRFGLRLPGIEEGLGRGAAHVQTCLTRLALFEP